MAKKPKAKAGKEFLWTSASGKWPEMWVAAWNDPSSDTAKTWMSPEEVHKTMPLQCMACGFLVERTKDAIKLCVTVSANGYSGQIITLPIDCLKFFGKIAGVGRDEAGVRVADKKEGR